jgi:hypothetical protein
MVPVSRIAGANGFTVGGDTTSAVSRAIDSIAGSDVFDTPGSAFRVVTGVTNACRLAVQQHASPVTRTVHSLTGMRVFKTGRSLGVVSRIAEANRRAVYNPAYSMVAAVYVFAGSLKRRGISAAGSAQNQ